MEKQYQEEKINLNIKIEKKYALSAMNDLHYHSSHYEIYLLLSGKQRYFIGNKFFDMHAGDIAVIKKGVLHKTQKDNGGNRILLSFNQEFLHKYFLHNSLDVLLKFFDKKAIRLESEQLLKAQALMESVIKAQKKQDEEMIFYNVLQLFILLNESNPLFNEEISNSVFAKTLEYVDKNFNQITCLEDVSNALFISKYHICHLFKTNLDITFNNYLLKIKLKEAKRLLINTNHSVTKIASLCNFTNSTYFCYVFRNQIGVSPTKYRKQNKKS
ncbi:MAG: AraC family transcriptional regulator [Clostridia bacterium]|nr:AraC family transcriptional regulator [Clostridia bacterium]